MGMQEHKNNGNYIKILDKEIMDTQEVHILKFIEDTHVVVFYEGRPIIASLKAKYEKYQLSEDYTLDFPDAVNKYIDEENMYYVSNPGKLYHINAPNGTTAKLEKIKLHYDIKYSFYKDDKFKKNNLERITYVASEIKFN